MGVCKIGRPIYIERSGLINAEEIFKTCEEEKLWQSFYYSYEVLQKQIFMACSFVFQKQIQHTFTILDMTNFSVYAMSGQKVRGLVQHASKISQDNYPEQLGQLFIVNAPYMFSTIWSVVKAWLDEKTREKIQIKGSDYLETVCKYVDKDQLPTWLGGKCEEPLENDFGPWNDFEIVDGVKPTDVVGVKQISTGKFISLDEMLTYPNYILGEETS